MTDYEIIKTALEIARSAHEGQKKYKPALSIIENH